jgi:DNA-binding IclR family transcriptional regulator
LSLSSPRSKGKDRIRAVDRAIDILMFIAHQDEPTGLSEISRQVKLDKATTLRLITTLKSRGLIRQITTNKCYEIVLPGPLLIGAAESHIRHVSRPYLEELSLKTRETISLVCPWGLERTHVEVIPAKYELRLVPEVGSIWPIYAGASGRAMMAFFPRDRVEFILRETKLVRGNALHIPSKEEILADLARIRQRGYLISSGETVEGGAAVAAPVMDRNGRVVAAISIRGPDTRMKQALLRRYAPLVADSARRMSHNLGFHIDPLSQDWQATLGWGKTSASAMPKTEVSARRKLNAVNY